MYINNDSHVTQAKHFQKNINKTFLLDKNEILT
jgi:hypothetical protein